SNEGKIQHYWFNYDLKIFQLI
ncbi:hypothetical protein, partial [Acinetobacter baumannii]